MSLKDFRCSSTDNSIDISTVQSLDTANDDPLFPLNTKELTKLGKTFLKSSFPTMLSSLAGNINSVVCLAFIGDEAGKLAGASLATTWSFAFCLGVILSINLGFMVVASQAYGAGRYRTLGLLYQTNLFVTAIIGIPLIITLLMTESVLNKFGLDPEVSSNLGIYLNYLIPSIIATMVLETTKTFLMAQNIFFIGGVIQVGTAFLNLFWCYLFSSVFDWGLPGVASAKSLTDITGAILIVCYCKYSGAVEDTWIPWDREALEDWVDYLKQVACIGSALYVEWISIEASIFIIGALNDKYITGAHGLALAVLEIIFTPVIANMLTVETFVGNAVGAGSKNKAQKVAFVAFVLNGLYVSMNLIILFGFNNQLVSLFTTDPTTIQIASTMLFYYGCLHFVDSYANLIGSILRTIGHEKQVFVRFMLCYIVIGINLEWFTAIFLGFSYQGVWWSMGFGMVLMFGLMVNELRKFDWDMGIKEVRKELGQDESPVYIEMKYFTV